MADNFALLTQITIDDTNKWIDINYNGGGEENISLTTGDYDNMFDLVVEIETKLAAAHATMVARLEYNGYINLSSDDSFIIMWKTGTHGSDNADTHFGSIIGHSDAADTSNLEEHTGDSQHMYGWYPAKLPREDSEDRPWLRGPETFVAVSGEASRTTWATHSKRRIEYINIPDTLFLESESATNASFEAFWKVAWAGTPFTIYELDGTHDHDFGNWTDRGNYVVLASADDDMLGGFARFSPGSAYYSFGFEAVKQP